MPTLPASTLSSAGVSTGAALGAALAVTSGGGGGCAAVAPTRVCGGGSLAHDASRKTSERRTRTFVKLPAFDAHVDAHEVPADDARRSWCYGVSRDPRMFITLMIVGLAGLLFMAMPAFGRHGHAHHAHAHGGRTLVGRGARFAPRGAGGKAALVATDASGAAGAASAGDKHLTAETPIERVLLLVPSPRAVCSVLALYGAFGNALVHAGHMRTLPAAILAAVPALLVERFVVRPVWNLLFRFEGQPSSPLDQILLTEATAVVPFRNGRGLVSVVRDGRVVQLSATLREDQAKLPVRVGDRVRVEEVDAPRERVIVSILDTP